MRDSFTFKLGGEAGFGILTSGQVFSKACNRSGFYAFDYVEYPSLIRGGHNVMETHFSRDEVWSQEKEVDLLAALNRATVDKARIALLQHLVAAKLNCAAFSCGASIKILIANADSAYAAGNISLMGTFASQLNAYNNMGDSFPIPIELGLSGSATPGASSSRANKIFWDSP